MMKWRLLELINYQKECRKFYYQYYDRSPYESWPSLPYLFNTTHISLNYQLNKEPIVVNFLGVIHRYMENDGKNIVLRIALGIFIASQICTLLSSIGIAYFHLRSGNKEGCRILLKYTLYNILTNCLSRSADCSDNNNNTGVGTSVRSR